MANVAISGLSELTTLGAADLFIVTDDSEAGAEQSKYIQLSTLRDYLMPTGQIIRPQFVYKDADEFYINGGGFYDVDGKFSGWASQLTFDVGSPSASTWYYLYADYSDITSGTALTASEFVASTTAPTQSHSKKGFYNGSDRCVFAYLTDASSNLVEFFHDGGDYVLYANMVSDKALTDIDTTWTDVTLTMPEFATKANATFRTYRPGNQDAKWPLWRTNGQSGTTGHYVCSPVADGGIVNSFGATDVITDSSQIIEVKMSGSNNQQMAVYTNGWYFPAGM